MRSLIRGRPLPGRFFLGDHHSVASSVPRYKQVGMILCIIRSCVISIYSTHGHFNSGGRHHKHASILKPLLSNCSFETLAKRPANQSHVKNGGQVVSILSNREHDDVIKWKHFLRYWPFVRGIHRSRANSPHKGQWHGTLMFSLICVWINGWVNNREAGDLTRYYAQYDIINELVMST